MTDLRQAAQQALEALLSVKNHGWDEDTHTGRALITTLRKALKQQQAEPVAYFDFQELKFSWAKHMKISPVPVSVKVEPMKLYSESTKRQWQGLTDEEITELDMEISGRTIDECVRAIEDKLKAKNDH